MTERLHFHFSLSCIGEGNGNPLQCSCLENPRDREPGGLPSMGSHRVGHDRSDLAVAVAASQGNVDKCNVLSYYVPYSPYRLTEVIHILKVDILLLVMRELVLSELKSS